MAMFEICVEVGIHTSWYEYQRADTMEDAIHIVGAKVNKGMYKDRWMISEGACREVDTKTDAAYLADKAYYKRVNTIQDTK